MDSTDLLKKVRKIEIKTRGLSAQIFSGEYHSAFKGRGMAFSEVREYSPGDDIRTIDWNVTARLNHPYVKVFEEERELTVMVLVDVSASGKFGTNVQFKQELITELTAVLAFSAIQNNDKAGVIFFSDKIELFIPPKKGKSHILRIIRELINFEPKGTGTDIGGALRYFNNMIKKKCIAFLISDFVGTNYEDAIKVTGKKHDLAALRIMDPREEKMPDVGARAQNWLSNTVKADREGPEPESKPNRLKSLKEKLTKAFKEVLYRDLKTGRAQSITPTDPIMKDPDFNRVFKRA
jgi:uncharacterized protein (DUF58 family)